MRFCPISMKKKDEVVDAFKEKMERATLFKKDQVEVDVFLKENPLLLAMIKMFFEKHEVPEFTDKRLNKQSK